VRRPARDADMSANADWLERSRRAVWHPCTQMKAHETPAARAYRARRRRVALRLRRPALPGRGELVVGEPLRHANPRINAALAAQLGELEHVILAGFNAPSRRPALRTPRGARAARPRPCVLRLRRRVGDRDRAQDGVPLLEEPRAAGEEPGSCRWRGATMARRSVRLAVNRRAPVPPTPMRRC